jgi:hypothetical protein
MMNPQDYIAERQYGWALRHGVLLDPQNWAIVLNDNLFLPMIPEVIQEYQAGAGQELNGQIPMRAPHSSSSLVVNVFHYWRLYRLPGEILSAISRDYSAFKVEDLRFEVQCPIPWPVPRGIPPHLDVLFRYQDEADKGTTKAVAIESKFMETYGQDQGSFVDSYLAPENAIIWDGLLELRQIAVQIHAGQILFHHLKVSQLIKHILGLKAQFGGTSNFELVYLWYATPGREAVLHDEEVQRFRQIAESCQARVKFRALTYQELIHSLAKNQGETHGAYVDYLMERYF